MLSLCRYSTRKNIYYNFKILVYTGIYLLNYQYKDFFYKVQFLFILCIALSG